MSQDNPSFKLKAYFTKVQISNQQVFDSYLSALKELHVKYPKLVGTDARVSVFNKCLHVLNTTDFSLGFLNAYLLDFGWWKENMPEATDEEISNTIHNYQQFQKIAFVSSVTSSVDSSFRVYVRKLESNAEKRKLDNFANVYEWLLAKFRLKKYRCLLHLIRLMRNTFHNNGIHVDKSEIITYKGKTYRFDQNEMVTHFEWLFLIDLVSDLGQLFLDIADATQTRDLGPIIDESADQLSKMPRFATIANPDYETAKDKKQED